MRAAGTGVGVGEGSGVEVGGMDVAGRGWVVTAGVAWSVWIARGKMQAWVSKKSARILKTNHLFVSRGWGEGLFMVL